MAAALGVVRERGLGALSVRSVAAAAGVGPTTLRHYFPTQAELHKEVAASLTASALDDLGIADAGRDPADRLAECLVQFLPPRAISAEALAGWSELYRLVLGGTPNLGVVEIIGSARRASESALRRWLGVLADQGHVVRAEIDAHVTRILALIDGIHLDLIVDPASIDLDEAEAAVRWFAGRVITPKGP
ncbi:MAG TPA: TetR/AcrR family transcriptional regulator [Lacisediminihabitans sp.]|uniref:TetR/AcrR family transcriptional regulator n=1 Tax=Lacisediminihabitans sp. TaxID=2787631 RepID=UPI002ED96EC6